MRRLLAMVWLLAGCTPGTDGTTTTGVEVDLAWSRATPPGAGVGVVYLQIVNHAAATDRLVSVATPAASRVELHETQMDGGVMRMRPVEVLELPSGTPVRLEPEGMHLMLLGLTAPLVQGTSISLQLDFEHAPPRTLQVPVLALGATSPTP